MRQRFLVCMCELDLAGSGRRLQVLEPRTPLVHSEHRTANGNRTRRHDQHLVTAAVQIGDVFGEPRKPLPVDPAICAYQ